MPVLGLEAPGGRTGAGLEQGFSCNPQVLRGGLQVTPSVPEQWTFRAGPGVSSQLPGRPCALLFLPEPPADLHQSQCS